MRLGALLAVCLWLHGRCRAFSANLRHSSDDVEFKHRPGAGGAVYDDVTQLSDTQFHVVNSGDPVRLECCFRSDAYNLFDNPVIWRKQQLSEWNQINVMGSLNKPFVETDRFEVIFSSSRPHYTFELTISDATREDSGNYTCEVRGPQSILLALVSHQLFVRVPVDRLFIVGGLAADAIAPNITRSSAVRVVEGHPTHLRCVALGGYPPPSVYLHVRQRDITSQFSFSNAASLTSGAQSGMRRIYFRSERSTDNFLLTADEDGFELSCAVTVAGLPPRVEKVYLDVDYSPKISCNSAAAHVGDRDVTINCYVRAKPAVTALFWIVDLNGTTQADKDFAVNRLIVTKERKDRTFQSQLIVRTVGIGDFKTYTIVAENSIALSTRETELQQIRNIGSSSVAVTGGLHSSSSSLHQLPASRQSKTSVPDSRPSSAMNRQRNATVKTRASMYNTRIAAAAAGPVAAYLSTATSSIFGCFLYFRLRTAR